jgi:hypothetical protein
MRSGARRGWLIAGILILGIGICGAAGLWLSANARLEAAVDGLARAPVGCDTVLDFDKTGDFLVFIETEGAIGAGRGDCDVDSSVAWSGDDLPDATVTITGPDGDEIDIAPDDGVDYDAGGSQGSSIGTVTIDQDGDHLLRVESDDEGFYVSVGPNPNDGVGLMRVGALVLLVVGLVVGVLLIVTGRRQRDAAAPSPAAAWVPTGPAPGWPSSPPGFPAPPPTTGVTGVVVPPNAPPVQRPGAPLPMPPRPSDDEPTRWGPPLP